MKKIILILIAVVVSINLLGYSSEKSYLAQDEQNIRSMFHVEPNVKMLSFSGSPKQSGWFGREGLHIHAIFQFTDQQFKDYQKLIDDTSIWQPVPFIGRTPKIAKKFTEQSCQWKPLPLSPDAWGVQERRFLLKDKMQKVEKGFYYSTICHLRYDDTPHYFKRYSCEESSGLSSDPSESKQGFARVIGVLDTENKKLYAEYQL